MSIVRSPSIKADDVTAALRDQRLAFAYRTGLPLVIVAGDNLDIVFANAAAVILFGVSSLSELKERLFSPQSPGGTQLRDTALSLAPQAAPRLLRLRLAVGRSVEPVILACRSIETADGCARLFAAFVTEVRRGLLRPTPDVHDLMMDMPDKGLPAAEPEAVPFAPQKPPTRSLSEVKADLQARFPGRQTLRFLWNTDEADAITSLGPELGHVVGANAAALVGKPLAEALPALSSGSGHAVEALARRETWNGMEMLWPVEGTPAVVPVAVSATPIFDPLKIFKGYRGFGVIHLHRLAEAWAAAAPNDDVVPEQAASGRNVVPLRGGPMPRAIADEPRPEPALSPGEHQAFRDIARALGVRMQGGDAPAIVEAPAEAAPREAAAARTTKNSAEALLEVLPIGILVTQGEVPLYLNKTLLDLLSYDDVDGFARDGGLARLFKGREAGQDADPWTAREGGKIPIVTRHGEVLTVDGRLQSIRWNGSAATLMSFRHSLEEESAARLRSLEFELDARDAMVRELRASLDAVDDAIVVVDPEGRMLGLNAVAETAFGYFENEIAGERLTLLLTPGSHAAALAHFEARQALGANAPRDQGRSLTGRDRSGQEWPLTMMVQPINGGGDAKFCLILRAAQKTGAEAEKPPAATPAQADRRHFLARLSHETRTPLNALLGFAEVMVEERFGPIGNERYKDYLQDIHASATEVSRLINNLLELSRIESGELDFAFAEVDLNAVVAEGVARIQDRANNERVVIRKALANKLPAIVTDDVFLHEIVDNLLSNAVAFNEPGGQVILSTALTDAGHVVLRIRDTGIGMSAAVIARAMQPFGREPVSEQHAGMGLGLTIARALTEAMHGFMTISSRPGDGTLVEVTFPRADDIAR